MRAAPAIILGIGLSGLAACTSENDDPCYQSPGLCDDAGELDAAHASADGTSRPDGSPDLAIDIGSRTDAMAVLEDASPTPDVGSQADSALTPEVDGATTPDAIAIADALVSPEAGTLADAGADSTAIPDAAARPDARIVVDAAPPDAAIIPDAETPRCIVDILSFETNGRVVDQAQLFCADADGTLVPGRQEDAGANERIFGQHNICGAVNNQVETWATFDAGQAAQIRATNCAGLLYAIGDRGNNPARGEIEVGNTPNQTQAWPGNGVVEVPFDQGEPNDRVLYIGY